MIKTMICVDEGAFRSLASDTSMYQCVVVIEVECDYLQLESAEVTYRLKSTRRKQRKFRTIDAAVNCASRLGWPNVSIRHQSSMQVE